MNKHDILQRIPMCDYPTCGYEDVKEIYNRIFNDYIEADCTVWQAVNGFYYHSIDNLMDENGMDKFVAMLTGMLFMIEHNDVEPDQAFGTNWDINDFESGEYDDLFTTEDLKLIKNDIKIIKEYLSNHPELLEE